MQKSTFRKNTFDLSPEIHQMAKKEELGELCKVYPVLKQSTGIFIQGQICMLWGILLLIVTVFIIVLMFFSPALLPALTFTVAGAASALLLLIVGCYMTFSRRIYDRWQIYMWQYGFIYEKKQIRQAFRWSQIESIQASVYRCKVRRRDGYEVTLAVFSDLPELIDVVLEESAHQLSLQELNILPAKSIKTFTTFKLDQKGISNEQETLSWQEIRDFTTNNVTVSLRKREE